MGKTQFKDGRPCDINGDICSYLDLIWREKNICAYNERGQTPDNVMIHPIHKDNIYYEVDEYQSVIRLERGKLTHIFGIKVIWTDDIEKDEIIWTYNAK